jgi:hypothetical protein
VVDTSLFQRPLTSQDFVRYSATVNFYQDQQEVTSIIRQNYDDYIVCYRSYNTNELELNFLERDTDGYLLGLESRWASYIRPNSDTTGEGHIKITLNYQPLRKNDLCDPGIRIFEAQMPYKILP